MKSNLKFNYKKGSKTKKGKPPVIRRLTKDHTLYPVYFNEYGLARSNEEVNKILEEIIINHKTLRATMKKQEVPEYEIKQNRMKK